MIIKSAITLVLLIVAYLIASAKHDSDQQEDVVHNPSNFYHVLAANWQSSFCEKRSRKYECTTQSRERYDANHFSLHGLWPQPRDNVYCGVDEKVIKTDGRILWKKLPALDLTEGTRQQLDQVMPGTKSFLHRHEWFKHGTCYSSTAEEYYLDSIRLMNALNTSNVRDLLADNIGKTVTASQIRAAFDRSFGRGAGDKIQIVCTTDGNRELITEIKINLSAGLHQLSFEQAIQKAPDNSRSGCKQGIVDPVGMQ